MSDLHTPTLSGVFVSPWTLGILCVLSYIPLSLVRMDFERDFGKKVSLPLDLLLLRCAVDRGRLCITLIVYLSYCASVLKLFFFQCIVCSPQISIGYVTKPSCQAFSVLKKVKDILRLPFWGKKKVFMISYNYICTRMECCVVWALKSSIEFYSLVWRHHCTCRPRSSADVNCPSLFSGEVLIYAS